MKNTRNQNIKTLIVVAIIAVITVSCGDKPNPQEELTQHTITLDFTAAFPHHTEVAASVKVHEWNPETGEFVDKTVNCEISESHSTCLITSNSNSMLYDCYVSYIDLSNTPYSKHAKFGSMDGTDKTYEIAFDRDKTYYWNDNAQYMVLR